MAEKKPIEAKLRAADRFASVGQLAAAVSHEINNPLTYVLSNLNFVLEQLSQGDAAPGPLTKDEMLEMLREARDGAERVRQIVRELQTLSQVGQVGQVGLVELVDQAEGDERTAVDPPPLLAHIRRPPLQREAPRSSPLLETKEGTPARGRLLVIDDEPPVARALARFLRELEVTIVEGGRAALEVIRAGATFDVILCDLMMPDLTGMEVHEQLGKEQPGLADRVIFMTGGIFTERAAAFLASVTNPRLEKPFDPAVIKRTVAEMIQRGR